MDRNNEINRDCENWEGGKESISVASGFIDLFTRHARSFLHGSRAQRRTLRVSIFLTLVLSRVSCYASFARDVGGNRRAIIRPTRRLLFMPLRVTLYSIMYAQCSRGDASWNIGRKRNSARDRNCVFAMRGDHGDKDGDARSIYRPRSLSLSRPFFALFRANRRLYACIDMFCELHR